MTSLLLQETSKLATGGTGLQVGLLRALAIMLGFCALGAIIWSIYLGASLAAARDEQARHAALKRIFHGVSSIFIILILFLILYGLDLSFKTGAFSGYSYGKYTPTKWEGIENAIVIDAGHGGSDPGAPNLWDSGRTEAADNLKMALALQEELRGAGAVNVFMTRTSDVAVNFTNRTKLIKDNKAILISLHRNSGGSKTEKAKGFMVIPNPKGNSSELAFVVAGAVTRGGGMVALPPSTAIQPEKLGIFQHPYPGVILECGYLTSKADNTTFDAKYGVYMRNIAHDVVEMMKKHFDAKKDA